ncbi:protein translocase subunit SecD [Stackebrandtia soli]|uniref:protein translocase subunit SecD n=1 Tax=Stackebrandtia soli TaxID=1892856 RepID=UPI0039EBA574
MAQKRNESASADQPDESNNDQELSEAERDDRDDALASPIDVDDDGEADPPADDEDDDEDEKSTSATSKKARTARGKPNRGSSGPRRRKKIARKQLRVLPYFVSLLVVTALVWLSAFAGTGFSGFPLPKLGLDLQGGLSMTLTASLPGGATPNAESMEQARQIIENRVNGTGVAEPEVYVEGSNNIVVNVAGKETDTEALREIGAPAVMRFREVQQSPIPDYTMQDPEDFETTPSEDAEDDEKADGDEEVDGSESPDPDASESPDPDASESPDPDASESPSDEESPETEEPELDEATKKLQDEVYAKLGDEMMQQAEALVAGGQPIPAESIQAAMQFFTPFGELTAEEVAVLPPMMQFLIPNIGCGQLNARTPGSISDEAAPVVACNKPTAAEEQAAAEQKTSAYAKYLLAPAEVLGDDVSSAVVQVDQANPGYWAVGITFTNAGADKWAELAKATVGRSVAIVLDNLVVSAPTIQDGAASGSSVEITGQFTSEQARVLAEQLNYGSLPVAFKVETIDEVSPTLGIDQMKAGLLAGAIGVLLVILYCMAYYRMLGFVVIVSLVASGAILYPLVAMLGSQIGFTLTLAGIAGFIVAIGITADSFVVFFERLKDEMKSGRSSGSAVPRAWARARHTILSANTVSFLAAVVLYFLAIGAVRGFAFTLGLSTLVDVLIVFLFTHPLVAWLSRGRILDSRALSGLHTRKVAATTSPSPSSSAVARPKES